MNKLTRRSLMQAAGVSAGMLATSQLGKFSWPLLANEAKSDSLPMQLYKSLSDEQKRKVCLPVDHPRRQYVSNWWYIHPDYRIPSTFTLQQQELIQKIFDSLHSPEYIEDVKKQVKIDQYGKDQNAPAVGFFGSPDDADFEFLYTGHHVTRRCNAHTDKGLGFRGAPIFYGHYPHPTENMRENFHETPEHPGNPYWYQGRIFNQFVQSLDPKQQEMGLVSASPRSERPDDVIKKTPASPGLNCAQLSADQKQVFVETMRKMMAMFRADDVTVTMQLIETKQVVERLHVSWYGGKYDIGSDKVWDTWQIEGPDMVWYFRGEPHIHCYFHLKT